MKISQHTKKMIALSLEEDGVNQDVTSLSIFVKKSSLKDGILLAKQDFVLSGLDVFFQVFLTVSKNIKLIRYYKDGSWIKKGSKIAKVKGPIADLLRAERTALNFLQHLSGIATLTKKFADEVRGTSCSVLDTRKTLPGFRALAKQAVLDGGGKNHRFNLSDMYLIKDNHIDACGGLREAVQKAQEHRGKNKKIRIQVETRNLQDVESALEVGADLILLDNMSLQEMKKAVTLVAGRCPLEASGGVDLKTVKKIAKTGVDRVSIGCLTHSVQAVDVSFLVNLD